MEKAPEPQNIIWENLSTTAFQRNKRTCGITLVICIFLIATFFGVLDLKVNSMEYELYYPPKTNCEKIEERFRFNKNKFDEKEYFKYA